MAVYVDDFEVEATVNGLRRRWSHLVADSHGELVRFGRRLRLSSAWIQKPGTPREHYDVTSAMRRRAIALGAVPVDYLEMQAVLTRKVAAAAVLNTQPAVESPPVPATQESPVTATGRSPRFA
jgi:hypothetical protein